MYSVAVGDGGCLFTYVVELVTEDVDAFAVVVDDVEAVLCVTS